MDKQAQVETEPGQSSDIKQQVQQVRELFAERAGGGQDGTGEVPAKSNGEPSSQPATWMGSAGRVGSRQGTVSESPLIVSLAHGGVERLRPSEVDARNTDATDLVGTVHDMRFVFLDNDTKLLFATTYDGDWDPYIDHFVAKIPDYLDLMFSAVEGYPGIHSP